MNLKRIAEELDTMADAASDNELDATLAACGLTADDDADADDAAGKDLFEGLDKKDNGDEFAEETEAGQEMLAKIAKAERIARIKLAAEKDNFDVEGVNSNDQDEFTQVSGVTENGGGQEDYQSVCNAAKKLASLARRLASVEEQVAGTKDQARYGSKIDILKKELARKATILRKAVADKTPFAGDLGHDGSRDEEEYGAYDQSQPAVDFEKTNMDTDWKNDKHDEAGFGIPKSEGEIPKLASIRLAANKAVKLAVCLLGNKAPEDMVEAQGRDFFASMDPSCLDRALRRFAETGELYDKKDIPAPAAETVAATQEVKNESAETPVVGEVKTVEQAANEISATVVVAAPVAPVAAEVVPEIPAADAPFNTEEEETIKAFAASIKQRRAAMIAEATKRVAAEEVPFEAPAAAPVTDEVMEAAAEVPAEIPAEIPAEVPADEIELTGGTDEGEAVADPALENLFSDAEPKQASVKADPKCAQKLPKPRLASVTSSDEFQDLWSNADDKLFAD